MSYIHFLPPQFFPQLIIFFTKMPTIFQLFKIIEIIFWIISLLLTGLSIAMIGYQLYALFIPYWYHSIFHGNMKYSFPHYFYRVYGDDIANLNYEHYGYLISALVVTSIVATIVLPNHPWKKHSQEVTKINKSTKIE